MVARTLMVRAMIVATLVAVALPARANERRGSVAFHYGSTLTQKQLAFFSRFDVLVTHDPLPRAQVSTLHARGTRLALYEWSVAFYRTLARPDTWHERLIRGDRATLLNANALRGHAGAADADAFYYDPADEEQSAARVNAIAARLRAIGYDGVFLDTTTVESVHPEALAEYRRRHPELPYDAAFARFLASLRCELRLIVSNQGYRAPEHYLPYVDYDITESLLTRPWHDEADRWNSVDFLVPELILPVAKRYPNVRFVHLNYADITDARAIETIIATARLYGHDAFVASADLTRTAYSNLYFIDLGRPVNGITRDALTSTRTFAHGKVVVTPQRARIVHALP